MEGTVPGYEPLREAVDIREETMSVGAEKGSEEGTNGGEGTSSDGQSGGSYSPCDSPSSRGVSPDGLPERLQVRHQV
jgi:hypothetical protein